MCVTEKNEWMSRVPRVKESFLLHTCVCVHREHVMNESFSRAKESFLADESCLTHVRVCVCVRASKFIPESFACGSCTHTCLGETMTNKSCHTKEWVMSYILWVMSHKGLSHDPQRNKSCHIKEWVMSHKGMSHVLHIMSHVTKWMSHVPQRN